MVKYFHFLYKKMQKYDKKTQNPFSQKEIQQMIFPTYIWVEKNKKNE